MSRLAMVLLICCAAWSAARAQDALPPAELGRVAFEDLDVIDLFLDLELDNGQASRMQSTVRDAQRRAQAVEARLAQARQAAQADMFKVRDALLAGKSVTAAEVPQWVRLRELEASSQDQLTGIWDNAYQDVFRRLTREQQARIGTAVDPAASAEDAAAARMEEQRQLAQRQQGVAQTVVNLMEQARRTPDPNRFRTGAPQAIAQATAGMTGLAPDHPLQRQLNQFFYTRLTQIYQLQPAPYAQARNGVAAEMTRAAMYVIAATMNQGDGAAAPRLIDPGRLQDAIRYERSPALLGEYAAQYRDPLAREREGAAPAEREGAAGARPGGAER